MDISRRLCPPFPLTTVRTSVSSVEPLSAHVEAKLGTAMAGVTRGEDR